MNKTPINMLTAQRILLKCVWNVGGVYQQQNVCGTEFYIGITFNYTVIDFNITKGHIWWNKVKLQFIGLMRLTA